jgi:hypothetical protein
MIHTIRNVSGSTRTGHVTYMVWIIRNVSGSTRTVLDKSNLLENSWRNVLMTRRWRNVSRNFWRVETETLHTANYTFKDELKKFSNFTVTPNGCSLRLNIFFVLSFHSVTNFQLRSHNFGCLILYLTTLFKKLRLYSVEWKGDRKMIDWKGRGRKRLWPPVLRYCICLEDLRKTMKNSVRIAVFRVKIWTRNLPNTKQER